MTSDYHQLPPMSAASGISHPEVASSAYQIEVEGYQILHRLGEGGMGTVWKAVQMSTQRPVALKLMHDRVFHSARAKARFEREIELAARLEHPNIARVYQSGLLDGVYYYAMELIEGEPLDEFVVNRGLDRKQILRLMGKVFRAVSHAHQRGIIHRDLKPSNILVSPDGEPHLVDFGLARSTEPEIESRMSFDGEVAGTVVYMSPEQAAGRIAEVDVRSEVYTAGVILYELLTGTHPHDVQGTEFEVRQRIVQAQPRRAREADSTIDRELEAVLAKSLDLQPDGRYQSMADFAADVDRYLAGDPLQARKLTVPYVLCRLACKHRMRFATFSAVVVLVATALIVSYVRVAEARRVAEANAESSRRALYLTRIALARSELGKGNLRDASELLMLCDEDQRRWEWHRLRTRIDERVWQIPGDVRILACEAVGDGLLTFREDGLLRRYDLATGACLGEHTLAEAGIKRAAISSDGQKLVVNVPNQETVILSAGTGSAIRKLVGGDVRVLRLVWSTDGRFIVATCSDRSLRVWDASSGTLCHRWPAEGVHVSTGGDVVGYRFGGAVFRSLSSGDVVMRIPDAEKPLSEVVVDGTGEAGVVSDGEGKLLAVDLVQRTVGGTCDTGVRSARVLCLSADPRQAVIGAKDGTIFICDLDGSRIVRELTGGFSTSVRASFGGDRWLISSSLHEVSVWNLRLPDDAVEAFQPDRYVKLVRSVQISPDGNKAAICGERLVVVDRVDGDVRIVPAAPIATHFSPDGRLLVAVAPHREGFNIYRAEDLELLSACVEFEGDIRHVAFSPDGRRIACVTDQHRLMVWNISEDCIETAVPGIAPVAWTSDGAAVLFGDHQKPGIVRLRMHEEEPAHYLTLTEPLENDARLVMDASGRRLAISSAGMVTVCDESRTPTVALKPYGGDAVASLDFDETGSRLLTAGRGVRLWDIDTGAQVLTLGDPSTRYVAARFGPEDRWIEATEAGGRVTFWSIHSNGTYER